MQAWNWDAAQVQAQAAAAASYASAQGYQPGAAVAPTSLGPAPLGYQQYYANTLPAAAPDLAQQQQQLEAQQQHWQQWQQWQQQYQQWQQEYGDKYQASLNSMALQGAVVPSAVNVAQPPPLPPPDKPPPPPEDHRSEGFQAQKRPQEDYSAEVGKKPCYPYDDARGRGRGGRVGRGGRWGGGAPSVPAVEPEKAPEPKKETPDELSEAEKAFDLQFQQWEEQFSEWKAQNINHPDKNQYREYEAKWRDWREKLLQRRVQMKKKREASAPSKPPEQQPSGPINKGRGDQWSKDQRPNEQRPSEPRANEQHNSDHRGNDQQAGGFQQAGQDAHGYGARGQADIKEMPKTEIKSLLDIPLGFMADQAKALLGPAKSEIKPDDKTQPPQQSSTPAQGSFVPQQPKISYNRNQPDRNQGNFGKNSGPLTKQPNNRNVLNFPKTFQISSDICKVIESQSDQPDGKTEKQEVNSVLIGPELPTQAEKPQKVQPEVIDITEEKKNSPNYDFLKKSTDGIPGLDLFNDKPLFGEMKGSDTPNSNSQNSSMRFGQDSSTSQDNATLHLGPGVQTSQGQGFQFPKVHNQEPPKHEIPKEDKAQNDSRSVDPFVNEDAQHGFGGPGMQPMQGFGYAPPGNNQPGMPGSKAPTLSSVNQGGSQENTIPKFGGGNQAPNFPLNQGQNFNLGNQGPNMNMGHQGLNLNPGNHAPNFHPGNQVPNLNTGNQSSLFNPGIQGPNLNTGNQGYNFIPGIQGPNLNSGNQGPNFKPGNIGQNFNPGNQGPHFNPGIQGPHFNPGKQGPNFNAGNQGPNFNSGNQGPPGFDLESHQPKFGPGNNAVHIGIGNPTANITLGNQSSNFGDRNQNSNIGPGNQNPNFRPGNQGPNFGVGHPNFGQLNEESQNNNEKFGMNRPPDNQNLGPRDGPDQWGSNQRDNSQDNWNDHKTPWSQGGPLSDYNQGTGPGNFGGQRDYNAPNQGPQNKGNVPGGNYPQPLLQPNRDTFPLDGKGNFPGPNNMGLRESFPPGPRDNFPRVPEDNFPHGPRDNFPQGPRDNFAQGPRDNLPQGPRDNFPLGPRDNFPLGPRDNLPQGPRDNLPQGPRDNVPQGPRDNFLLGPRDNIPQGPRDNLPQGPRDNFPLGPRDNIQQSPRDNVPPGARNNFPQGPRDTFPIGQRDNFQQSPRENFPPGPRDNFAQGYRDNFGANSRESFPRDFRDNFPEGPRDGYPLGPRDNVPPGPRDDFHQGPRGNFPGPRSSLDGNQVGREPFPNPRDLNREREGFPGVDGRRDLIKERDFTGPRGDNYRQYDDYSRDRHFSDADRGRGWDQEYYPRGQFDERDNAPYRGQRPQPWESTFELEPATIVEYGHKPAVTVIQVDPAPVQPAPFLTPVQTFDYGHGAANARHSRGSSPPKVSEPWHRGGDDSYQRGRDRDFSRDRPGFHASSGGRWERGRREEEPLRKPEHEDDRFRSERLGRRSEGDADRDRDRRYRDIRRDDSTRNGSKSSAPPSAPPPPTFTSSVEKEKEKEASVKTAAPAQRPILIEDLLSPPGRDTRPSKIVVILRGPPGSGKSFVARLIKDKEVENGGSPPRILCLDDYFIVEVEKEQVDEETGRRSKVKVMEYEYEAAMEKNYRSSLIKAFRKTVNDNYFPFIIVDCVNQELKHFDEMWSHAKQKGFQTYICEMDQDLAACVKRNVHHRTEPDISAIIANWQATPSYYIRLDVRSLLQSAAITEVEMEDSTQDEPEEEEEKKKEGAIPDEDSDIISKWERMEPPSGEKLDRMDGLKRRKEPRTLEDWLTATDDYENRTSMPGKKRVRWADLEEKRSQEKMRAIGFVVGQTDWSRMTDPTCGESALTQTKYI